MSGIALDTQDLRNYLQFLPIFTLNFKPDATAHLRQLLRQMYQGPCWSNILSDALRHNMRTAGLVPLGAHFKRSQVARTRTGISIDLTIHVFRAPCWARRRGTL